MSSEGGNKAIVAALSANLGIAITKFLAFLLTGLTSMLAESIHSAADTGNQVLLLFGGKRAKKDANEQHPFGYGRERYLAAFVVSIVLFSLGGLFSLYEAWHKFHEATGPHASHPSTGDRWWWVPIVVILASMAMEGASFRTALQEANKTRGDRSLLQFVRAAKDPEVPVVLLEDSAAVAGLLFALIGICLATFTQNAVWDAAGAAMIGLLLVLVACVLGIEMKSLLLGESAAPGTVATIRSELAGAPGVTRVIHLKTSHLGPQELLVAAKIGVDPHADGRHIADTINAAEEAMRRALPQLEILSYLEPDIDTGDADDGSIGHRTINQAAQRSRRHPDH